MRVALPIRSRWRRSLPLAVGLLTGVLLLTVLVHTAPQAAAADGSPLADTPQVVAADDFAVSDSDLAVAIFIPGIFLVATGGLIAWAWANRKEEGAGDEPADEGGE